MSRGWWPDGSTSGASPMRRLKKCITYGVDTRTRHCVTQQFVDSRLEIIKAKLNTISSKFCYEYKIDDIIDGICEITKEILKWLQEA